MPAVADEVTVEFFNQGIQAYRGDGAVGVPVRPAPSTPRDPRLPALAPTGVRAHMGVHSASVQRRSHCYLFMDDTTLLAKTPEGMEAMIAAHMNFCRKFRMRLNVAKSKLMRFTREGDDTL